MIDVFDSSPDNIEYPQLSENQQTRLCYKDIVRRGYAVALLHTNDVCDDDPATYQ